MATDVTVHLDDHPGEPARLGEVLGDAGVNITLAYLATRTRLVVAADDLAKAEVELA